MSNPKPHRRLNLTQPTATPPSPELVEPAGFAAPGPPAETGAVAAPETAPAPEAAEHAWTTSTTEPLSAPERELVRKALGKGLPEHDVYQAEPVVNLADALYRPLAEQLERSHFDSLLVTELLSLATRDERQSGDDAVLYAGALGAFYRPDVEGLLGAWRKCSKDDELTRSQIAWAACRAPLSQLLERLAPDIAEDPQPSAAP